MGKMELPKNEQEKVLEFSKRRIRLYHWFFKEYNNTYINYEKYYKASDYYKKWAKRLNLAVTVVSASIVFIVLATIKGAFPNIFTPVALMLSLVTGVLSFVDAVGDFERKYIQYYNAGQCHDDLYSEFDKMVKIKLPDNSEKDEDLEARCDELIEKKNELNSLTPQLDSKWYDKLIEERGKDAVHWKPTPLKEMRDGKFQ
ncbi:hypothetical protein [Haladaptatus sp. DFWS20]|uniref:hypothetical protein n=1 Tax=Haladaptatus sp. DFWS20 TaxID=3403467 RepID=UPI003EBEE4AC